MTALRRIGILGIALWGMGLVSAGHLHAATDGYTLEDLQLHTAGDLVDLCSIDPSQEHYTAALAFCYGFFEGGIRFKEAISSAADQRLVCAPEGTTRLQAVEVFVGYMKANPQHVNEGPIDAIFRALIAKWPCPASR